MFAVLHKELTMNQRIRELAEQATEYANEQNELHGVDYVMTFKEKFAELIVRECLTIADKEHKLALEFEWDNDDTAQTIKDSIKKHFGVEE